MNIKDHDYKLLVKKEWSSELTISGWCKWFEKQAVHTKPFADALLQAALLKPGQQVLDIASGTGLPAFSITEKTAPSGLTVATDLSVKMLKFAKGKALEKGLEHIVFSNADAHYLPFKKGAFDRVSCQMGIMYFWNCHKALKEILRVLKPGGMGVFIVWGPVDKSPFLSLTLGPFLKRKPMPVQPADMPGMTRFATPGSLSTKLSNAGFAHVKEKTCVPVLPWPGTPEELWQYFYELAEPLRPYFDSFKEKEKLGAIQEIIKEFSKHWNGGQTLLKTSFNITIGIKL